MKARAAFLKWIWYASRRAGLHLDGADDDFGTTERIKSSLLEIAPTLRLTEADQEQLLPHARLARYGTDETLQAAGQIPKRMTFLVQGRVQLSVKGQAGMVIPVRTLDAGDFIGQTTLTREPLRTTATALEEVIALQIEREHLEELVLHRPVLLQEIGRAIEERHRDVSRALASVGE
jgi:CRP-like cAMP-binding protein